MVPTGTATVLRVFLASPGDVAEERAFVRTYLESVLPKSPLLRGRAVRFDVIAWDDPHAPTSMPAHMTPQEAVIAAKGRPSDCHIVIVILASRLGTHLSLDTFRRTDGSAYRSGTEWEYEDAWDASPRPEIRVYRRTDLPPIQTSDLERRKKLDQLDLVDSFFERFTNPDGSARGGYQPYTGIEDFRTKLTHDLQTILADQVALAPGPVPPPPAEQDTTNVPLPPRCLGRDDDLSRIVGALKSGTTPTAILVRGPGGIGKTTLTQQAAHDPAVIDRFGQRRWFAELETAVDRDSFDAQLLLGMGLDPTQGFAAALRRLGQAPALLVLDNLETAWDAAGPAIEARIGDLATVPGIALLASIRGERPVGGTRWLPHRLTPLSDPDARALFCAIADTIPDSDPNLPELLKELGGVPLAVCLTARQAAGQTDLSALWAAWQRLGSGMAVWGGVAEDHLTSVPHSIALSLNAPGLG
ncbi:MAG: NB-ARC domain-containing protein, partial [Acetobacteraceae bacterium]